MTPWCVLAVCLLLVVVPGVEAGADMPHMVRYSWLRNLQDGGKDFPENAYKLTNKDEMWIRSYLGGNNNQLRSAMVYTYPPKYQGAGILTIRQDSVCLVHNIKGPSIASMVAEAERRNSTQSSTVTSTDDVIILRATRADCNLRLVNPAVAFMCRGQVVPFNTNVLDAEPVTLENSEVKTTVTTFSGKAILIYPRQPPTSCRSRTRTARSSRRRRCRRVRGRLVCRSRCRNCGFMRRVATPPRTIAKPPSISRRN